ncbi:hypothetical protein AB1Y20_019509 [Prymnesium parvum]|uniref:CS domain-containing protein n=1 Tax=Prymnesium parvum TaxID=97485 RepID=A0AB34JV83_PRYPA
MPAEIGLGEFLQQQGLSELGSVLFETITLREMQSLLSANRPKFLTKLKELGVHQLGDRQKLANALTKMERLGQLPASEPIFHLIPPSYVEDEEEAMLVVRLLLPASARRAHLAVSIAPRALHVRLRGERTSCCGTLFAPIDPHDSSWQLERSARGGGWRSLFTDAVASRVLPGDAPPPRPPRAAAAAPHGVGFTPRRFDPRGAPRRAPREARRAEAAAAAAWEGRRGALVWREGWAGPPPRGGEALYGWREGASALVLRGATRASLTRAEVELRVGEARVELRLGGERTMWCGALVGGVVPAACGVELLPTGGVEQAVVLTLAKAEATYWRAPFPELLPAVEAEEKARRLPTREQLRMDGWSLAQTATGWKAEIPIKDLPDLGDDYLRFAVAPDAFNLYIAGQENAPLLAGETFCRLNPGLCSWRLTNRRKVGTQPVVDIELIFGAASGGGTPDLIKTWLT